jgi:hypothetical protein
MDDRKDVEELAARLLVAAYGSGGPIGLWDATTVHVPIGRAFVAAEGFIAERNMRRG